MSVRSMVLFVCFVLLDSSVSPDENSSIFCLDSSMFCELNESRGMEVALVSNGMVVNSLMSVHLVILRSNAGFPHVSKDFLAIILQGVKLSSLVCREEVAFS